MSTIDSPLEKPPLLEKELPTKFVITLEVEAEELYELPNHPTKADIYKHCFITDTDHGKPWTGKEIERFESYVDRGQLIEWEGKTTKIFPKNEYTVAIESVVYAFFKENELDKAERENFFNTMAICRTNGKGVMSQVRNDLRSGHLVHIYNINFNVSRKGDITRRYSIDPRLKIER